MNLNILKCLLALCLIFACKHKESSPTIDTERKVLTPQSEVLKLSYYSTSQEKDRRSYVQVALDLSSSSPSSSFQYDSSLNKVIEKNKFRNLISLAYIFNDKVLHAKNFDLSPGCYSYALENKSQNLLIAIRGISVLDFFSKIEEDLEISSLGDLCIDERLKLYTVSMRYDASIEDSSAVNFLKYLQNRGFQVRSSSSDVGLHLGIKRGAIADEVDELLGKRVVKIVIDDLEIPTRGAAVIRSNIMRAKALTPKGRTLEKVAAIPVPKVQTFGLKFDNHRRPELLQTIQSTYFKEPPERLVYFGSGADVQNPFLATRARNMVFIDRASPNGISEKLEVVGKAKTLIKKKDKLDLTRFESTNPQSPLRSIDYYRSGYTPNLFGRGAIENYSVIFDKDSWIEPNDVHTMVRAVDGMDTDGIWISNHLYTEVLYPFEKDFQKVDLFYAKLFDEAGFKRVTQKISRDAIYAREPFGNGNALEVFQKTPDFNLAKFQDALEFFENTRQVGQMINPFETSVEEGILKSLEYEGIEVDKLLLKNNDSDEIRQGIETIVGYSTYNVKTKIKTPEMQRVIKEFEGRAVDILFTRVTGGDMSRFFVKD